MNISGNNMVRMLTMDFLSQVVFVHDSINSPVVDGPLKAISHDS